MLTDIPLILPLVAVLSLVLALVIYGVAGKVSAKGKNVAGKEEAYACGENITTEEVRVDLERFLTFAVYFLIFDVLAFVTATSFYALGLMPIAYSLIVLMAVGMLLFAKRRL